MTGPADQVGLVLSLSAPQMVIGHSDTADLILEDRFVSRRHALVITDASGAVTILDLNSTGGTFVNDERIDEPRVLQPGDAVRFADLIARFEPAVSAPGGAAANAPTQLLDQPPGIGAAPVTGGPAEPVRPVDRPWSLRSAHAAWSRPWSLRSATVVPGSHPWSLRWRPGGPPAAGDPLYTVTGTVTSPALPGVAGLTVQLVDKNVGGQVAGTTQTGGDQVLGTTQTGSGGQFSFTSLAISLKYLLGHHKTQPDLQVQVLAGGQFLAASPVSYSAPQTVVLNVVLPAGSAGLPSEYETLTANLGAAYPGSLGALQEGNGRSDITYLANKTGWDARAVALAALADQFSQITAPNDPPAADPAQTAAWPLPTVEPAARVLLRAVPGGPPGQPGHPVPGRSRHRPGRSGSRPPPRASSRSRSPGTYRARCRASRR